MVKSQCSRRKNHRRWAKFVGACTLYNRTVKTEAVGRLKSEAGPSWLSPLPMEQFKPGESNQLWPNQRDERKPAEHTKNEGIRRNSGKGAEGEIRENHRGRT